MIGRFYHYIYLILGTVKDPISDYDTGKEQPVARQPYRWGLSL